MKSLFRPWKLWFALACATAVSLPFLTTATSRRDIFFFEITLSSNEQGIAQLFYDVGQGITEPDSGNQWLNAGGQPVVARFGLPMGTYRGFRFDPNTREAIMTMADARIVDNYGTVIRRFTPEEIKPANQISGTIPIKDGVEIHMVPGANDPNFQIPLTQPLVLSVGMRYWLHTGGKVFLGAFLVVWLLTALPYGRFLTGPLGRFAPWCRAHPVRALLLTAAVSVAVQCHPVIFFGKSFMSPNNAVYLLYDTFPTLPSYTDTTLENAKGADVGAMMWQHSNYPIIEREALFHSGELPLWNRYDLCGVPLLGQGQSMFGDPMNFFTLVANGGARAWDARFVLMRVLFAFGTGLAVWMLVRHFGAALLVTACIPFIGFFAFRFNHPAILSVCWSPWVLVCWCGLLSARTPRARNVSLAGLVVIHVCMMSSGTVKEAAILTACLDLAGALLILLLDAPWRERLRKLGAAAFAGVVFALIAAPGWISFLVALGKSRTNYDTPGASQLPPWQAIGFFEDLFYRQFRADEAQFEPSTNFVILAGVLWALAVAHESFLHRRFLALALAALVPLTFIFGVVPVSLIVRLPFIANIIHVDNTFAGPLIVLSAVLAGFGFAAAARQLARDNWLATFGLFVLLLSGLALLYFGSSQATAKSAFFQGYIPALFIVLIACPIALRCALREPQRGAAVVVLVAGCALLLWRHSQYLSSPFDAYVLNPQVRARLDPPTPAVNYINTHRPEPARTVGLGYNLFPGYHQMLHWESIYGVDAIRNKYLDELADLTPLKKMTDWVGGPIAQEDIGPALPMQDLMNVRYYLATHQATPRVLPGRQFLASLDLDISESPTVWPRAFFTSAVRSYNTPQDFVRLVVQGDGRPAAFVQEKDRRELPDGLLTLPTDASERVLRPATDYQLTNNTTSFTISADRPGVVVLSESYYPGDFQVTLNETPSSYFRVNHAFKGIYLSRAGTYRISFRYWPERMTLSLWLFTAGVVLAIVAWLLDAWLRRAPLRVA